MTLWKLVGEVTNETGLVFGAQGEPLLPVAVDLASAGGTRPVGVIAAANQAGVREVADRVAGVIPVNSSDSLNAAILALKQDNGGIEAVVFYGLPEYVQQVLDVQAKGATPTQAEWGEMAATVAKDLRHLMAIMPVVYVTCDVVADDQGGQKLNINPGLQKFILGDLAAKRFVITRQGPDGEEVAVQDNNALALQFKAPRRERPAADARPAIRGRR